MNYVVINSCIFFTAKQFRKVPVVHLRTSAISLVVRDSVLVLGFPVRTFKCPDLYIGAVAKTRTAPSADRNIVFDISTRVTVHSGKNLILGPLLGKALSPAHD